MITIPMTVAVTTPTVPMTVGTEQQEVPVGLGANYTMVSSDDYELLSNKPQINGVELEGNKLLADLFEDGIIIDGGGA